MLFLFCRFRNRRFALFDGLCRSLILSVFIYAKMDFLITEIIFIDKNKNAHIHWRVSARARSQPYICEPPFAVTIVWMKRSSAIVRRITSSHCSLYIHIRGAHVQALLVYVNNKGTAHMCVAAAIRWCCVWLVDQLTQQRIKWLRHTANGEHTTAALVFSFMHI